MASISASTSLATFPTNHASSSKLSHITLNPVHGSANQLAVAAVQGDGIWTYDLATLRPTASFTVPPSTVFATRPISFYPNGRASSAKSRGKQSEKDDRMDLDDKAIEDSDGIRERITVVGVLKGEKVKPESEGKVLWVWRGDEGDKEVIELLNPLHSIHYLKHPRYPVLCVSTHGDLTLLDHSLEQRAVTTPASDREPNELCAAGVVSASNTASRAILLDTRGYIRILRLSVGEEELTSAQSGGQGWIGQPETAVDISCADVNNDGVVTVLTSSQHLLSRSVPDFTGKAPYQLPRLKHRNTIPIVLFIPSPGLPLALVATPHPSPSILLTSSAPSLPVVLAISSVGDAGDAYISDLSIIARPSNNAFVVASVLTHKSALGQSGRSIIYISEVTLPPNGIGMNILLGREAVTKEYFNLPTTGMIGSSASAGSYEQLIPKLKKELSASEPMKQIEDRWTSAIASQEIALRKRGKDERGIFPEAAVRRTLGVIFGAALRSVQPKDTEEPRRMVPTGRYASQIIKELLVRKVVTETMWPEGVVAGALLPCNDWDNIYLALRHIQTISSSTLIAAIKQACHSDMEDRSSDRLSATLGAMLALPVPSPTYRLELRKTLPVEDATAMLDILTGWAEHHAEKRAEVFTRWAMDEGVEKTHAQSSVLPSIESVIAHTVILLDAHLPLFLAHEPSHDFLLRLQTALEPLIAIQHDFRQLRGPVEGVWTLARREKRKREEREAKRAAARPVERPIWGKAPGAKAKFKERERRDVEGGQSNERALPEAMVGKWRVEEIVF